MAQTLDQETADQIKLQNETDIALKAQAQRAEGKTFNIDATGHGPGVVPDDKWDEAHKATEAQQ